MAAKETAKTKKVKTIYLQIIFCDTGIDLVDSKEKDISRHLKVCIQHVLLKFPFENHVLSLIHI